MAVYGGIPETSGSSSPTADGGSARGNGMDNGRSTCGCKPAGVSTMLPKERRNAGSTPGLDTLTVTRRLMPAGSCTRRTSGGE